MTSLCPVCGKPINPEAKFCAECGAVAVTPTVTQQTTRPEASIPIFGSSILNPAAPPKRKRHLGLAIALGTVAVGWLLFDGVQGYRNAGQVKAPESAATPQSALAANASASSQAGGCLSYSDVVKLTGTITSKRFPGDPESVWVVVLNAPICTNEQKVDYGN